ncbi:MAG: insulinase family protein, partial [Sulfurimonas sp.]
IFLATCNPGVKAEDVESELIKQIELLKSQKVSHEELQKVKTNTKADFIYSLESSTSVANLYGSYLVRGDIKPLIKYQKRVEKLDEEEILRVANKYFNFDASTTVILKK